MSLTRKRILATGGASFLESHLCDRLTTAGNNILCIDNYFIGRKDNIAHLLGDNNFEAFASAYISVPFRDQELTFRYPAVRGVLPEWQ
jgi:UDP-glucose 4-epimerase